VNVTNNLLPFIDAEDSPPPWLVTDFTLWAWGVELPDWDEELVVQANDTLPEVSLNFAALFSGSDDCPVTKITAVEAEMTTGVEDVGDLFSFSGTTVTIVDWADNSGLGSPTTLKFKLEASTGYTVA